MADYGISECLEARADRYVVVNALSRRVRALMNGAKPLVNYPLTDLTALAIEEFKAEKIEIYQPEPKDEDAEETEAEAEETE